MQPCVKNGSAKLALILACLALGSAPSGPAVADDAADEPKEVLFYPPLPEAPRIQHLVSYAIAADVKVKEEKKGGWLSDFVLGEERPEDNEGPQKPYGITISKGQIHVVDTRGAGYATFDVPKQDYRFNAGSRAAFMPKPINITVDDEGNRYVTDTGRNQILVFDPNDEFLRSYGGGTQMRPTDMHVTTDKLYVVDIAAHRVVVLDKESGEELYAFGSVGSEEGKFFQPTNISEGPTGNLYITDTGNFRVQEYTPEGEFVRSYGWGIGRSPGQFARPKGNAVDRSGNVYVVDAAFERVQIFNDQGRLLLSFGQPGASSPGGMDLPTDIAIDYDSVPYFQQYADPDFELEYIIVVANQFGFNKVNVFGFGRHKSMSYDLSEPAEIAAEEDEDPQ